ncbi:hypothetical protein AMS68_001397 [Peltaster fructicola]|uniref:RRM domain-containing protein n=1 Tax=Peltaster fructicola TaxID=286661 RepID=A0A6H0XN11_9PEZI|nr:hypothetical protein AMS68_001397 [Peltaster fructicola]
MASEKGKQPFVESDTEAAIHTPDIPSNDAVHEDDFISSQKEIAALVWPPVTAQARDVPTWIVRLVINKLISTLNDLHGAGHGKHGGVAAESSSIKKIIDGLDCQQVVHDFVNQISLEAIEHTRHSADESAQPQIYMPATCDFDAIPTHPFPVFPSRMSTVDHPDRNALGHGLEQLKLRTKTVSRHHQQSSRDDRRRDRDGDRGGDRRRRSRSPAHRHRNGHEENSYESSRNYREREREQRYGGDNRERRDWDRDRGSARRDARRDDDDRRRDSRRDRDHFDDRRRHRDDRRENGDREQDRARDRDDMRQMERQQRQKSASPVRKPKEPTPDLTDIVSVLQRKRRLTQWDVKPTGYDNVTAEQAKLSGMFPLPGAPRAQPMDQSRLQAFMSQPQNQVSQDALKSTTSRQSKRVIVQNLPEHATDSRLSDFFNLQLNGMNLTVEKDPCVLANVSADHQTALLEFKTPEDATNALALDGAEMDNSSNVMSDGVARGLQIRRPKDYIVPAAVRDTEGQSGRVSRNVPDTQSKIMITKIPTFLDEDQIQELLQSFGELRSMALAKDADTNESRGFAFCEWIDAAGTDTAVEALNGMQLGEVNLIVQKACTGLQQVEGEMSVTAMSLLAGTKTAENADSGRVLCLMNMITPEEILDPDEADEITDDVRDECAKFGTVVEVKMPRPTPGDRSNAGIGKIYIKFGDSDTAQKALAALAGRKFADRTVVATFFSEEYFNLNAW